MQIWENRGNNNNFEMVSKYSYAWHRGPCHFFVARLLISLPSFEGIRMVQRVWEGVGCPCPREAARLDPHSTNPPAATRSGFGQLDTPTLCFSFYSCETWTGSQLLWRPWVSAAKGAGDVTLGQWLQIKEQRHDSCLFLSRHSSHQVLQALCDFGSPWETSNKLMFWI